MRYSHSILHFIDLILKLSKTYNRMWQHKISFTRASIQLCLARARTDREKIKKALTIFPALANSRLQSNHSPTYAFKISEILGKLQETPNFPFHHFPSFQTWFAGLIASLPVHVSFRSFVNCALPFILYFYSQSPTHFLFTLLKS